MDQAEAQPQAQATYDPKGRKANEQNLRQKIFVQSFPSPLAGAPLPGNRQPGDYASYAEFVNADPKNLYAPFRHKSDWEVACWAKLRKVGANTLDALLAIDGLCKTLGLSYHTAQELNRIIDNHLPEERPRFKRAQVSIQETAESYDVFYRDVLQCIKALYGDATFARYLVFFTRKAFF